MAMASSRMPSENILRGGHATNALGSTKCLIQKLEDIQSAQAFNDYADGSFDDVFHECLHKNHLYMVGRMTREGLARTFERYVFASCNWYENPATDLPYINFRGIPGTNLWVKVHNLSPILFHPIYEGDNDGLREVWRNSYTRMNDGTAKTLLDNPVAAEAVREMQEMNAHKEDSEPEYPRAELD
ncbi:hypothetical protein NU219Hw_g8090t1 [Hortaea werneckii]